MFSCTKQTRIWALFRQGEQESGMIKGQFRKIQKMPPVSGGILGLSPFKEEEKKKAVLLSQGQEFVGIHWLVVIGDTEMDMAAQC